MGLLHSSRFLPEGHHGWDHPCNDADMGPTTSSSQPLFPPEGQLNTDEIWPFAGYARNFGSVFYKHAQAIILVYDITNKNSLTNLQALKKDALDHVGNSDPNPVFIMGTLLHLFMQG
jgi:GTPase SAR1 family protein